MIDRTKKDEEKRREEKMNREERNNVEDSGIGGGLCQQLSRDAPDKSRRKEREDYDEHRGTMDANESREPGFRAADAGSTALLSSAMHYNAGICSSTVATLHDCRLIGLHG